jgi:isopenicillin-N epimerase
MRRERVEQFPLRSGITMFNHASYGLATSELLERAHSLRRELESDPNLTLGEALQERLDQVLVRVCAELGLDPACSALTSSAADAAAALQRSIPLSAGQFVVALDCEYSSVLRGWQRRCDEVGAQLRIVPVPLPLLDLDALLDRLTAAAAGKRVAVLQFSAITSAAALQLPVDRLAAWGHERAATVVVDAAHVPGQLDLHGWDRVDAAFATVHKWIPVPRSVGLLWATPELAAVIAPATVSLTYDDPRLGRRFAWPGTFDPAPRLCLPGALDVQRAWADAGELDRCRALAGHVSEALTAAGAIPTGAGEFLAPRMRSFILPGVPLSRLRPHLLQAGIRAWTGAHGEEAGVIRCATQVYNDAEDVALVAREVAALLRTSRG